VWWLSIVTKPPEIAISSSPPTGMSFYLTTLTKALFCCALALLLKLDAAAPDIV